MLVCEWQLSVLHNNSTAHVYICERAGNRRQSLHIFIHTVKQTLSGKVKWHNIFQCYSGRKIHIWISFQLLWIKQCNTMKNMNKCIVHNRLHKVKQYVLNLCRNCFDRQSCQNFLLSSIVTLLLLCLDQHICWSISRPHKSLPHWRINITLSFSGVHLCLGIFRN